jgi:YHS domain-containing protein
MTKWIAALAVTCFSSALLAQSPPVSLKGHDPVSYFTDGRPVKGSPGINYDFDEARYLFSSQKNRQAFAANPERYTPQFAGLCATGMSLGMKAEADPAVFRIIDGKLYVFSSTGARDKAVADPSLLAKSQHNWRTLR